MTTETRPDTAPKPIEIKPKKRRSNAPVKTTATGRKKNLTKPLTGTIATIGTVVSVANKQDGFIIINGAERLAESLNNLAKENDSVYRALSAMVEVSVWGEVGAAVLAIALPIMANHDLLPVELPKSMTVESPKESADGY